MNKKDKVQLLTNLLHGKKPEKQVFIIYTDNNLIVDPDSHKCLQPGEEEHYLKQVQRDNPLYNVVPHFITKEKYKTIVEEIEKEI